jgi:hypothetical protein
MKTLTQIIKEFGIQFCISIAWGIYKMQSSTIGSWEFSVFIANFSACLFFLSWMFGQVIRIKKQHKIENEFEKVKSGLTEVLKNIKTQFENLEQKTSSLIGYMTGGSSYFYYRIGQNFSPDPFFFFEGVYVGDYPTNNVKVSFTRADVNIETFEMNIPNVNFDTINRVNMQFMPKFLPDNTYTSYIIFEADNKIWVQTLDITKQNNSIAVKSMIHFNGLNLEPIQYLVEILDWSNFSIPK